MKKEKKKKLRAAMQLCSIARLLVVVTLPRLLPLSSTSLALAVTVCILVDRRGWGCHFVAGGVAVVVATFVNLGVYRHWALLVVSGPTHRICVVVVHSSLLGGIRQWSSLGRIRRCWAGFTGIGLRWGG